MAAYRVTPAGDNSGDSWANAMALSDWETSMDSASAGDIYYVAGGTYTLTGDFDIATDGDDHNPIWIIGVASGTTNETPVYSDWAFDTDRPLIAASTNNFTFDNYWYIFNLRITTSDSLGLRVDERSMLFNCKSTATTASISCFSNGGFTGYLAVNCEADGDTQGGFTKGFNVAAEAVLKNCYAHDCTDNYVLISGSSLFNCISDTASANGMEPATSAARIFVNECTIYNCASGIAPDGSNASLVAIGNIISDCTTGMNWSAAVGGNWGYYNNYHNNTSDVSNWTKGPEATAVNPSFTDAANGDFTIANGSSCEHAGMPLQDGVG